jgi:hypothetical protein
MTKVNYTKSFETKMGVDGFIKSQKLAKNQKRMEFIYV